MVPAPRVKYGTYWLQINSAMNERCSLQIDSLKIAANYHSTLLSQLCENHSCDHCYDITNKKPRRSSSCPGYALFQAFIILVGTLSADGASIATKRIGAEQIDDARLVLLAGIASMSMRWLVCRLFDPGSHHRSATSLALVQLVAGGIGSTLVPATDVESLVDLNQALRKLPLAKTSPHWEIAFIVRRTCPRLPDIERLRQLFRNELKRRCGRG